MAIICTFSWLSGSFKLQLPSKSHNRSHISDEINIEPNGIRNLEIYRINGNVDIDFVVQPSFIDVDSVSDNTKTEFESVSGDLTLNRAQ